MIQFFINVVTFYQVGGAHVVPACDRGRLWQRNARQV